MPLSEHEQRLLEQMERALYAEDPQFATQLRAAGTGRAARGRAALGLLGVLVGLGLVIAGVATQLVVIGVVGFAVMLVGAVVTYGAVRGIAAPEAAAEQAPAAPKASSDGFMNRMEDRWRRRFDGDDH